MTSSSAQHRFNSKTNKTGFNYYRSLISGYCRESCRSSTYNPYSSHHHNMNNRQMNIPLEIIKIMVIYSLYQSDCWDRECTLPAFTITQQNTHTNRDGNANANVSTAETETDTDTDTDTETESEGPVLTASGTFGSSYLKNVVRAGKHVWTFRMENDYVGWWYFIGIWKLDRGPMLLDKFFNAVTANNGYAFAAGLGKIADPNIPNDNGWVGANWSHQTPVGECRPYGRKCKAGDIIQMCLNFEDLTLSYIINEVDYGKAFDVERTSYRAVVSLFYTQDKIRLLSYTHAHVMSDVYK